MPRRRISDKRSTDIAIICEGTDVTGTVAGNQDVLLAGTVHGDADISATITVTETGHWHGDIRCGDLLVSGRITGAVEATGCIEIGPTARIEGAVIGASIAVGEGAVIDGELHTRADTSVADYSEKRENPSDEQA